MISKYVMVLALCLFGITGLADSSTIRDLQDICTHTSKEHVFAFKDSRFYLGIDASLNPEKSTVAITAEAFHQSCYWWQPRIVHCHTGNHVKALWPSFGYGAKSDIGFLVSHEQYCRDAGRPSWYPPIVHGVLLSGFGPQLEVVLYSLGPILREVVLNEKSNSMTPQIVADPVGPDEVVRVPGDAKTLANDIYRSVFESSIANGMVTIQTEVGVLFKNHWPFFRISTQVVP